MDRQPRDRRAIFADLSADQMEQMLAWFIESYESGWRPQIFFPENVYGLHLKGMAMLVELRDFHRKQEEREAERARRSQDE